MFNKTLALLAALSRHSKALALLANNFFLELLEKLSSANNVSLLFAGNCL